MKITDEQRNEIKTITQKGLKDDYAYSVGHMAEPYTCLSIMPSMYTKKELKVKFHELIESRFDRIIKFTIFKHMIK
jgi:hypothetical protein